MNTEKVRLILHIGQHKTGSKALQSFLAHNTQHLLKRGVLYPISQSYQDIKAYRNSHFNCFLLARRDAYLKYGHKGIEDNFLSSHLRYCDPFLSLNELFLSFEAERVKCGARCILLSAEDLFDMETAHDLDFSSERIQFSAEILLDAILKMNWMPEIVVYLRRPDHLLNSHYAQYIKGNENNTLDFDSFTNQFQSRLNGPAILNIWIEVFGQEKIRVLPYERESLPKGIVMNFFEKILGFLPDENWLLVPRDLEYDNITPRRAYIDFLRLLNICKSLGLLIPPRESVLSVALNHDFDNHNKTGWVNNQLRDLLFKQYRQDYDKIAESCQSVKDQHPSFFKETWNVAGQDFDESNISTSSIDKLSYQEIFVLFISMIQYVWSRYKIKFTLFIIGVATIIYGAIAS